MKPRPEIVLHIEEVFLDGLPSSLGLREALQQELVRLLSAPGALDSLLGIGEEGLEIPILKGGTLPAGPRLGQRLGQSLFQTLCGVACSAGAGPAVSVSAEVDKTS